MSLPSNVDASCLKKWRPRVLNCCLSYLAYYSSLLFSLSHCGSELKRVTLITSANSGEVNASRTTNLGNLERTGDSFRRRRKIHLPVGEYLYPRPCVSETHGTEHKNISGIHKSPGIMLVESIENACKLRLFWLLLNIAMVGFCVLLQLMEGHFVVP